MRKTLKFLIVSGACLVMAGTGQMSAQAAMNLETDAPVAGASVAINNYYASSLNPEKELAEAFASKEVLAVAGAGQTGVAGGAQTAKPAQVPAETKAQPKETTGETEAVVRAMSKSIYDNIAISRVTNYVNVRAQASTGSEVVGKIYNNCAATILDTVDGEGGKWYHIQSGSVTGYIKAQYFVTGEEASKIAREVGTTYAKVTNTSTLRLRETPSLEGKTLDLLSADAEYEVIGEEGDFAKISVDNDLVGYVYKDYITTQVDFKQAVSVAEEQQQKAEEEKLKQEANAAIENLEQVKKKAEEESRAAETTAAAKETTAAAKETTKAPETSYSGTIEANPSESKAAGTTAAAKETTKAAETKAPTTAAATKATTASGVGPGGGNHSPAKKQEDHRDHQYGTQGLYQGLAPAGTHFFHDPAPFFAVSARSIFAVVKAQVTVRLVQTLLSSCPASSFTESVLARMVTFMRHGASGMGLPGTALEKTAVSTYFPSLKSGSLSSVISMETSS